MAAKITEAHKSGLKVSVLDDDGNLLWYSSEWSDKTGAMQNPLEPLGQNWLEFVHQDHIAKVRRWIADRHDEAQVRFLAHSGTTPDKWLMCVMIKRRVGRYWLAVGDNRLARADELAGGIDLGGIVSLIL